MSAHAHSMRHPAPRNLERLTLPIGTVLSHPYLITRTEISGYTDDGRYFLRHFDGCGRWYSQTRATPHTVRTHYVVKVIPLTQRKAAA